MWQIATTFAGCADFFGTTKKDSFLVNCYADTKVDNKKVHDTASAEKSFDGDSFWFCSIGRSIF